MALVEIQIVHERNEWAYATYVMCADSGCLYSNRFEYADNTQAGRGKARDLALADANRLRGEHPKAAFYSDLKGGLGS